MTMNKYHFNEHKQDTLKCDWLIAHIISISYIVLFSLENLFFRTTLHPSLNLLHFLLSLYIGYITSANITFHEDVLYFSPSTSPHPIFTSPQPWFPSSLASSRSSSLGLFSNIEILIICIMNVKMHYSFSTFNT